MAAGSRRDSSRKLGLVALAVAGFLMVAPAATALVPSPTYWKDTAARQDTVNSFFYKQAPHAEPVSYQPVSGPASSLTTDFRSLPRENQVARKLWREKLKAAVKTKLLPRLGTLGVLYMGGTFAYQRIKVGDQPGFGKVFEIGVPGAGNENNQRLNFRTQGTELRASNQPMPYDGWVWDQNALTPSSGTSQWAEVYETYVGDCDYRSDYDLNPPPGFDLWVGATLQCFRYGSLVGGRTPRAAYTPEDALTVGSAVEDYNGQAIDRYLTSPPTPPQTEVEQAIETELAKPENGELRQWINFHLGSPGETDPTGVHPDPNPDIDFPDREKKRGDHGQDFTDPYGPGSDELQRYHKDAAEIVRKKVEEGLITISRCKRGADTLYWDPAKRAIVIVRDGKIANYFPPTRGYDFFRDQCDLGTID